MPKPKRTRGSKRADQCSLCKQGVGDIDYKEILILKRFITPRGRIRARSRTGTCAKHQRQLSKAIKKARIVALLPFVSR